MAERAGSRWRRRVVTIPSMLAVTTVAVIAFPLFGAVAVAVDVVRFRLRLPVARTYLFVLQYLINDSIEIVLAPLYWVLAGFGRRLNQPASIARHERLQNWSVGLLVRRAAQMLGLRVEVDQDDARSLEPGPVIVLSRHTSVLDASLPGVLYRSSSLSVRGVIMAELLADPGFDLIYGRLGSVFIARDDGPAAVAEITAMTAEADEATAYVIFPEGRLFRPEVLDRAMARLAESDPERACRLAPLDYVLPPRPGGVLALLDALPTADVVVIRHRGLDRFRRLGDLVGAVPVKRPVRVEVERIDRSDIPSEAADRVEWLDGLWLQLDGELRATASAAEGKGEPR